MEVHAHTHTPRKKWTHYFWEFLMLFLAVFCGFLAENFREHQVERHREKQFMSSLVRDIELDTVQLFAIKKFNTEKLKLIDSVIIFFGLHTDEKVPAVVCSNTFKLIQTRNFYQNTGTIDQLKNSGGFRLVTKRVVVDSIEAYDQQIRRLANRDKFEFDQIVKNNDIAQKLFDGQALSKLFIDTIYYGKPADLKNTFILLNTAYIKEYLNQLTFLRYLIDVDIKLRGQIALRAANLISLIKKEYRLK